MTTQRPQSAPGDEFVNLGICILISCAVLALLLRDAGSVAAWATGIEQPAGGIDTGIAVLFRSRRGSLAGSLMTVTGSAFPADVDWGQPN